LPKTPKISNLACKKSERNSQAHTVASLFNIVPNSKISLFFMLKENDQKNIIIMIMIIIIRHLAAKPA
jgi:hypothetical protein